MPAEGTCVLSSFPTPRAAPTRQGAACPSREASLMSSCTPGRSGVRTSPLGSWLEMQTLGPSPDLLTQVEQAAGILARVGVLGAPH